MNRLLGFITLVAAVSGCVNAPSTRDYSPGFSKSGAQLIDVPVRGFRATLFAKRGQAQVVSEMTGELVAVDDKHLWVVADRTSHVQPVHREYLEKVSIVITDSPGGAVGPLWGLLGIGSTLTHGIHLIYSAPLWLTGAITATAMIEAARRTELRTSTEFQRAYQYARFPQGLPAGLGSCPKHPSTAAPAGPTDTPATPEPGTDTSTPQPTDPPL